jgi:predicted alpha/beta-hydrolase family hydrolase
MIGLYGETVTNKKTIISLEEGENISAVLAVPDVFKEGEGSGIIIAHGAGNDMNHPLLVFLSAELAGSGYITMRFNFPYKEKGKKAPDSQGKLERTWILAYEFFRKESGLSPDRIFAAGKSMGGRIASQLAAKGKLPVGGLILLGYPLHPPGRKEKLRDAHLAHITVPMLYFAGTRDSLCDLESLKNVLKRLKTPWDLEVIEGGDHSFKLPKSYGTPVEEINAYLLEKTVAWLKRRS